MARDKDKTAETLERIFTNPVVLAGFAIASAVLTPVMLARTMASPEKRARFRARLAEDEARRREVKARSDMWSRRTRTFNDYFSTGAGRDLLREKGRVTVGPEPGFEDALFSWLPSGFRQARFAVGSRCANARVEVGWDVADRDGAIRLERDGEPVWGFGISASDDRLGQYSVADELPDVECARLACRLLNTEKSPFRKIVLTRPEFSAIKYELFRQHLNHSPELGETLGWDDSLSVQDFLTMSDY